MVKLCLQTVTEVHQTGEVNLIESIISKPSQENFQ